MLIYQATLIRPGQLSPGELLTRRKHRALLPVHQYLHLSLEISREAQIAQKQARGDHYNWTAKQFQDLQQFQSVCFQLQPKKPVWHKATVIHQPSVPLGDMKYRLNLVLGFAKIVVISVPRCRTNHKGC